MQSATSAFLCLAAIAKLNRRCGDLAFIGFRFLCPAVMARWVPLHMLTSAFV
jgi:hypothetical protein